MSDLWFFVVLFVGGVFAGGWLSKKTGSSLPQMFSTAFLVLGVSVVFNQQIDLNVGDVNALVGVSLIIHFVNLGLRSYSIAFTKQWKIVCISLGALVGAIIFIATIGVELLDETVAIASSGTIIFGVHATLVMRDWLSSIDKKVVSSVMMFVFALQMFIGLPLLAYALSKESKRLLSSVGIEERVGIVYYTKRIQPILTWGSMMGFGFLFIWMIVHSANRMFYMSGVVLALGLIQMWKMRSKQKLLQTIPIQMVGSLLFLNCVFVLLQLEESIRLRSCVMAFVVLMIMMSGCLLFAYPIGKKLGYSSWFAGAIGLNMIFGFPFSLCVVDEVITSVASNDNEKIFLYETLGPNIIVSNGVSALLTIFFFVLMLLVEVL